MKQLPYHGMQCCVLMILWVCSVTSISAQAKPAAQVALQQQGITVWEVPVKNSSHLGFKAQADIDASVAQVYAVIRDVDQAQKWIPSTRSVSMIDEDVSKGDAWLYYVIDMPFPLTDRDLVIKSKITQDAAGNVTIKNVGTTDARTPEKTDYIRITNYQGTWQLKKLADNKTRVTLSGHADPRGGIPSWVANMFVTKQPYEMLRNMRKQVKKPRYNDAKLPIAMVKKAGTPISK